VPRALVDYKTMAIWL